MTIVIGILLILGGIGYAGFMYKTKADKMTEVKYMQTSSIKDALEVMEEMSGVDQNYRQYVELKGTMKSDEPVVAQFSGKEAAYYDSRCYSVNETTETTKDEQGHMHTHTTKNEYELSNEKISAKAYITDNSSDERIYVNFESFGSDAELMTACDRFENRDSQWSLNFMARTSFNFSRPDSRFLGYHLKELFFPVNTNAYVLGEILKNGDNTYSIEKAHQSKKPSALTYKSEEEMLSNNKKEQITSLVIGAVALVIGIFLIINGLK